MLWQRVLFGVLMIVAVAGVVTLDGWLSAAPAGFTPPTSGVVATPAWPAGTTLNLWHSPLWTGLPITLLVVLLAVLASYELGRLLEAGGHRPVTHWAAFVAAGLVFIPWLELHLGRMSPGGVHLLPLLQVGIAPTTFWLTGGFVGACLLVLARQTTAQAVSSMATTAFMFLYTGLLAAFAVRIRSLWPGPAGAAALALFLLAVKGGDIGAYFTGLAIGRHKLVPWLSPGKTVEGFLGAVVFACGVAVGGVLAWRAVLGHSPVGISQAIVFAVVMAIVGHLGDFVESAIKRDVGSKDSGRVVPAFGGLLDILDSPLLAAPVAWWLLTLWAKMG